MKTTLTILLFALCFSACAKTATENQTNQPATTAVKADNNSSAGKSGDTPKTADNKQTAAKTTLDKSACLKAAIEGKKLIPSQTFVFDYEPFKGACFVTFANKEDMVDDKDVPRGSKFYIYKDGKQVYEFEDAFDGQEACWVEGVGFEDLNADGKTEVIIAGSCLGAKDSYPQNAVYLNLNDDFKTFNTSNSKLENLKTVKEISDYVKKNKNQFFSDK